MRQKMWVRKVHYGFFAFWEVGCQCCGSAVGDWITWGQAMWHALNHTRLHS